jgi:hypothetical protein
MIGKKTAMPHKKPCFPIFSSVVSHEYTKENILIFWGGFPLFF